MSLIKNTSYYTVQGWMVNELQLCGVELQIFAIIYGFSQDGESKFSGSRQYLADWCGCTTRTVSTALASLVDKQLITKHTKQISQINQMTMNEYAVNFNTIEKISSGGLKKFQGGVEKISLNNIDNTIDTINSIVLSKDNTSKTANTHSLFSNPKDNDTVDENVLVKDENKNSKNETPVKKLTKSNKAFDNAIALVDELFTDDYVKQKLKEYLPIRLSMKDTKGRNTYSFSAWKRQLNKLHTLTDSADERIAIIQQSIDRCYMGFFPVSKRKSYSDRYDIKVISNELDTVHSYKNKGDVMSGEIF